MNPPGQSYAESLPVTAASTLHRLLLQAPAAMMVVHKTDFVIELVNTRFLQLWNRREEELLGKPLFDAFPRGSDLKALLEKIVRTGTSHTLYEVERTVVRHGREETAWFDLEYEPLLDEKGEVERVIVVCSDVTRRVVDRRRAEAMAGTLHSLANAMPQLVWMTNAQGVVTYYNDRVKQFAGAEQLPDGSWRWEGLLHDDDVQPTADAWNKAVREGGVYEKEHRVQMLDGSFRWHLSRGFPYKNESGEVLRWYGTATDIHEVKRAEEALAYQKGLLETVTRNTTLALFMLDGECCVVYQNEAAEQMTGYSLGELLGRNLHDYVHHSYPDGRPYPVAECPLAGALRAQQKAQGEEVFVRKDGTFFPVYFSVSPIIVEGAAMGMVVEVRDTTAEKAARQALLDSEDRLRVATTSAGIGTWSYDLVNDKVYATDQYKRLFGLSPDREMNYELFLQAVVEEDRERTDQANRDIIEMKDGRTDYQLEYRVRGIEDGQLRWLKALGKVYPGEGGRPSRFAGAVMDITREKEAQISLAYRKALLEAQSHAIPGGLLVVDTRGSVLSYNRHFAALWGMPSAILEAGDDKAALAFAMSRVSDPQAFIDRVNHFYQNTTEAAREEIELTDGRVLERYGNAVIDEDGTLYGWAWYFHDITNQKRFTDRLEALVRQRTAELQNSNDDLQQFAHVTSHDMKEPLRKIRTFASRLHDDRESVLSERGRLYLGKVERAAERLSNMIEGVLTYSMVNATKEPSQPVDLARVVRDITGDLEVLIAQKEAQARVEPLPVITGAPVLIHQLFYNLVNNSLKFSRPGVPPQIDISSAPVLHEGRPFVRIVVRDNGIGFSPEYTGKIFETFARLNPKDQFEGTGLGLSLCKKIVERHGGTITAEGQEGEGAVFTILLPE